jgi:lipopolysaccharide biosynthesis glycosyltransferase
MPKHPSVRARQNKSATRATLIERDPETVEIPDLPVRLDYANDEIPWDDHTVNWWVAMWSSPMSSEYHSSDIHGLYRIADLSDMYWKSGDENFKIKIASEIRLAIIPYGLTPLDRRRLEWNIETSEKARDEGEKRRATSKSMKAPVPGDDPRLRLA